MKNANLRNNEFYSAYGCKECDADYQCLECDTAERVLFQDGFDSDHAKDIYLHLHRLTLLKTNKLNTN